MQLYYCCKIKLESSQIQNVEVTGTLSPHQFTPYCLFVSLLLVFSYTLLIPLSSDSSLLAVCISSLNSESRNCSDGNVVRCGLLGDAFNFFMSRVPRVPEI